MVKKTWYALYVRSRWEKKSAQWMTERGYTVYLPLVKTLKQWSDRKKKVEIPLISSYVFIKVSEKEYYKILETPGVVSYVTFEGKAAPIRDSQIDMMRNAIEGNLCIEAVGTALEKGQRVKVISGPMKGAEGEFVKVAHKTNFIINMNSIGFSLKVELNADDVVKL